jgi:hypothetical protein
MDPRTSKRLIALLAAEIEQAARRILTRDDDADIEEILAHVELQISFMREVRYRSAPLQVRRLSTHHEHTRYAAATSPERELRVAPVPQLDYPAAYCGEAFSKAGGRGASND